MHNETNIARYSPIKRLNFTQVRALLYLIAYGRNQHFLVTRISLHAFSWANRTIMLRTSRCGSVSSRLQEQKAAECPLCKHFCYVEWRLERYFPSENCLIFGIVWATVAAWYIREGFTKSLYRRFLGNFALPIFPVFVTPVCRCVSPIA